MLGSELSFKIEDNVIGISSSHTSYLHCLRKEEIKREELINLFNKLCKLGKEKKARIYNKKDIKKILEDDEIWESYKISLKKSYEVFEDLKKYVEYLRVYAFISDTFEMKDLKEKKKEYLEIILDSRVIKANESINKAIRFFESLEESATDVRCWL